jgi:dipeptidase D
MSVLGNLEPRLLWQHFDEIRQIPHGSGNEKAMSQYVVSVAQRLGLKYVREKSGNVIIYKPATPGRESAPPIVLQGHLDMVCEKHSAKAFDFMRDPIGLLMDNEWLTANGTTLGADNGIGVAATLAVLEEPGVQHGPLEALFTVDEERGLKGARTISAKALKGRIMLNLDSEELGVFSIGCAGGADSTISLPIKRKRAKGTALLEIHLSGLRGGHSGIDIHEGRGNAIKILNRLLWQMLKKIPFEIVFINGGDKHNAIPREVVAQIAVPKTKIAATEKWLAAALHDVQVEFRPIEEKIKLSVTVIDKKTPPVLDAAGQEKLLGLIFALPHGPLAMSRSIRDLVETSNNVAAIKCEKSRVLIVCSSRSSNGSALKATRDKLAAIVKMVGAKIQQPEGYPGWMPNLESPILQVTMETFRSITGKNAHFQAIHAGLECGIIGEKFPGMDMISFGPTIQHPHSPEERVHVGSVGIFYKHLTKILESLC